MALPQPEKKPIWTELQNALEMLRLAEFEVRRGETDAALVWLNDVRGALGAAALAATEQDSWARFAGCLVAQPHVPAPRKAVNGDVTTLGD